MSRQYFWYIFARQFTMHFKANVWEFSQCKSSTFKSKTAIFCPWRSWKSRSLSLQRPQKKQPPLPKGALTLDRNLAYHRFSGPEIHAEKVKRIALTNQKPAKRPPLLRKVDNDNDETSSVSSVDQNDNSFQNHDESSVNFSSLNTEEMSRTQKLRDANKKKVIYPCQRCA